MGGVQITSVRATKCNVTFSYPVANRQCKGDRSDSRKQKGSRRDAESDDGCSGSRFTKLRLLAAAGAECVLHHRLLIEQLAMILKCIKGNFCTSQNLLMQSCTFAYFRY